MKVYWYVKFMNEGVPVCQIYERMSTVHMSNLLMMVFQYVKYIKECIPYVKYMNECVLVCQIYERMSIVCMSNL